MITKDDIATYRATYPREHLDQKAKEQNLHCGTPLGSVLALNALCDAYEEIERHRDELVSVVGYAVDNPEFVSEAFDAMCRAALASVKGQQ